MRHWLLAAFLLTLPLAAGAQIALPDEYRMDDYHAPVPDRVPGGTVVHATAVEKLRAAGAILIDVLPAPRRPPAMKPGVPWLPAPHLDIPGSVWLPDFGRGALNKAMAAWFHGELRALTHGDSDRALVFYCQAQCWMSWNAAKRAARLGFRQVYWFPEGVDGWRAAGFALAPAAPLTPPDDGDPPA
ncbi:MAG: PQQ-dependent catabolism-associated CXXCW motif protein [Acidibrevibacterium sp.]|uniref:rhodanese-like domain-containing protein n=1 Tax=Acidibrevibacterium fodinaquatile TaxID=1969806 RepID=UPI00196312C2|nr:rhodanese-like domain-containing protein [Acidibrevibacterium fodinaquatile]MCA7119863.1 PQQ-dependent catabolism-associated CXXCW motif protein [Acidibrevibacterium fodinaquatile]